MPLARSLRGDPFLLSVEIRKLLEHAPVYTCDREEARIQVQAIRRPDRGGLEVIDNSS